MGAGTEFGLGPVLLDDGAGVVADEVFFTGRVLPSGLQVEEVEWFPAVTAVPAGLRSRLLLHLPIQTSSKR